MEYVQDKMRRAITASAKRRASSGLHKNAQSAIEYAMTYGWAVLIIAVVVVALLMLGAFTPSSSASRAQPGSCQVKRPYGPGTVSLINLNGLCNGLKPQYVAGFNGGSSYVDTGNGGSFNIINAITVVAWINPASFSSNRYIISNDRDSLTPTGGWGFLAGGTSYNLVLWLTPAGVEYYGSGSIYATNQWQQAVFTFDGTHIIIYKNGVQQFSTTILANTLQSPSQNTRIGVLAWGPMYYFNGIISNVQIYNTSLSASEVQALYVEGIGGTPIVLQNLVGWWPLNGDTNDYSGNGNNGVPYILAMNSTWVSTYTGP
jgi:hypothetical protein